MRWKCYHRLQLAKMFPSTILRAAILVIAASEASATIYQICPICPQTDLAGYKLILGGTGYALDPPRRFCGYASFLAWLCRY